MFGVLSRISGCTDRVTYLPCWGEGMGCPGASGGPGPTQLLPGVEISADVQPIGSWPWGEFLIKNSQTDRPLWALPPDDPSVGVGGVRV